MKTYKTELLKRISDEMQSEKIIYISAFQVSLMNLKVIKVVIVIMFFFSAVGLNEDEV